MAQLHVELVSPERELWSGEAHMVVAKTVEGDIGVLPQHAPVLASLADGSVVRVMDDSNEELVRAAVDGGFLSIANDRVSVLAEVAEMGDEIDVSSARNALEQATAGEDDEDSRAAARHARARLAAAGEEV